MKKNIKNEIHKILEELYDDAFEAGKLFQRNRDYKIKDIIIDDLKTPVTHGGGIFGTPLWKIIVKTVNT